MRPESIVLLLCLLAASWASSAADYRQAPGSTLGFAGTYQGEAFAGRFPDFATRLSFDPAKPAAGRLEVSIALATATLGLEDYDGELRGPAFLDSGRNALAHYSAQGFRDLGGNRYAADGVLSLRGTSRPVTLEFTWLPGKRPVLTGSATVRRLAFGVGSGDWADTELLPDDISITTRVLLRPVP